MQTFSKAFDAKLSINVNYTSYVTDEGFIADEKLEPRIDFTYKGPFYSLKLTQNWYVDLDERRFRGDDNYNYLERLPEAGITFNPIDLYFFNCNLSAGAARFHEAQYVSAYSRMRHITSNRYSVGSKIYRTDNLGFGTTLNTSLSLDQFAYELGDQRYRFEEAASLDTGLWGFFRNSARWGRARVDGSTPFFFESLGSQHNYIKDTISLYYLNIVNFDVSGGYNYMNSTYDDVLTGLRYTPNEKVTFNANTGWSIENQRYRDLILSAAVTPFPKFVNTAGIQYDMNVGKLLSANSLVDLEIGDTWEERWHLKMYHSYDVYMDRYMLRDLAVAKDLHCWEAMFTYNDYLKEFRFTMSLKAFPEYPFTMAARDSGYYFESFLNNMRFEQPSPRRY